MAAQSDKDAGGGSASGAPSDPPSERSSPKGLLRRPLVRVFIRRIFLSIALLFVASATSFVLVSITPGDVTLGILGANAPQESYDQLREALGLDLPLYEQYWNWMTDAVQGDLGRSAFRGVSVSETIQERLGVTISLIIGSLIVSLVVGLALGVVSAVRGRALGRFVDAAALVGFALPVFWVGAVLIMVFAVYLGWFPATGYVSMADSIGGWLKSLALPVAALSLGGIAALAKQTREAMLDVLGSEYVRMAWANGVPFRSIIFRHALKNTAIRVITVLGVFAIGLLGGAVLIEAVFALPGVGKLAVDASLNQDLPMVQGVVVFFVFVVVLINFATDLAYSALNPQVRTE